MKRSLVAMLASGAIACGSASTCPATPTPVPPKKNALLTRSCAVLFDDGLDGDARIIAALTETATTALSHELGPIVEGVVDPARCRIHLFGFRSELASEDVSDVSIMPQPPDGRSVADVFFFAPSLYDKTSKSSAGQPKDADWWSLRVTASLANVMLRGFVSEKKTGWRNDAPSWFWSGYNEYLGCTLSTPKGHDVVLRTYVSRVKSDPSRVRIDSKIEVEKRWDDGAVFFAFLADEVGKKRVQSIYSSAAPTFDAAFDEAVGPDRAALAAKFSAWLQKQP